MCGIAGFIDRSEANAETRLRQMLDRMIHRGPDDSGTYVESTIGFAMGMRRLSIIDLECGKQPIWNEDESVGVVFNGEIYNYRELRHDLEAKGHAFRTRSDTEVLVHLYEEHGTSMFEHLRGMFAFCIRDRTRQSVLLARDHFGQKPLYYTEAADRFAFASELKSLLTLPWVDRTIDREAFLDYTAWLSLPAPRTHFHTIKKLPAGSYLEIPGTREPRTFWRYSLSEAADLTDFAAAVQRFGEALTESVRLHLHADVPVGVLLSGGIDSRAVAACAKECVAGPIQTFTATFDDPESEGAEAEHSARELGTQHHTIELNASDLLSSIERIAFMLDEPVGDPACFAVWKVCEFARERVKVLLSGEGSDELLGGYETRYRGMLETIRRTDRFRRFRWLMPAGQRFNSSRWQRLFARSHSSLPGEIASLRMEGLPGDIRSPRGMTSEQVAHIERRTHELGCAVFRAQRDRLSELLAFDLDWQLAESLLQKADKMSMAASIELRTPFLDREVADVAARIPSDLKLRRGGAGKFVLREFLTSKFGPSANRPKKGFPIPIQRWFRSALREPIEAALFAENSVVCSHLDRKLLRTAWEEFQRGECNEPRAFYALWLYETWHQVFTR